MQPTILITGAAGGFGRATARLFAANGYFVGLYDLNPEPLEELRREIGEAGSCAAALDVTREDSCRAAVDHFAEHTGGRMDVLLNNAGIMVVGNFEDLPLDRQFSVLDVNVNGLIRMTHLAFPLLRDTPDSQVINLGSASALHGNPELVTYSLSKRAVQSFTESLDIAWEGYGIRVKDINPMYARTNMVSTNRHLLKKLAEDDVKLTADDVASAILAATRGGGVHQYVGRDAKAFSLLGGVMPFAIRRRVLKKVIGY